MPTPTATTLRRYRQRAADRVSALGRRPQHWATANYGQLQRHLRHEMVGSSDRTTRITRGWTTIVSSTTAIGIAGRPCGAPTFPRKRCSTASSPSMPSSRTAVARISSTPRTPPPWPSRLPAARHYRKYPYLGSNTFSGGQTGQSNRTTWRHEVDALKSWLAERLEWIDGAPQATDARPRSRRALKPTDVDRRRDPDGLQPGGNVPLGLPVPPPAIRTRPAGTTYYTIDGPDPRQAGANARQPPPSPPPPARVVGRHESRRTANPGNWLLPSAAPANDATRLAVEPPPPTPTPLGPPAPRRSATARRAASPPTSPPSPPTTRPPTPNPARPAPSARPSPPTGTAGLTSAVFEIMAERRRRDLSQRRRGRARQTSPSRPRPATYGQEALGPIDPGSNYVPASETMFVVRALRSGAPARGRRTTLAVEVIPPGDRSVPAQSDERLPAQRLLRPALRPPDRRPDRARRPGLRRSRCRRTWRAHPVRTRIRN